MKIMTTVPAIRPLPFSINRRIPASLTQQVADGVLEAIGSGCYRSGDRLPGIGDMAAHLEVSHMVIRGAVKRLAMNGHLVARPKRGILVASAGKTFWHAHILFVYLGDTYVFAFRRQHLVERLDDAGIRTTELHLTSHEYTHGFPKLKAALDTHAINLIVTHPRNAMPLMPDLLSFRDGGAVTAATWRQRRQELYDAIIPHEYGGMPPAGEGTEVIPRARVGVRRWPGVIYRTVEVRTRMGGGKEVSLTLSLWLPPGDGPFPVVLNGDGCWRSFDDDIARMIVDRGMIAASFDRTEAAADNKDRYRETGLYRLFPDAGFGALAAWAWAYHRCVDALCGMREVRTDAIAVSGHSRGGKTVLLAGATDERIAVTHPNDSGIGGSGLNRLKVEGSERVADFCEAGTIFWFGQGFRDHLHHDADLPYDQHFLHALVAPRPLLVTEAYEDHGANPPGSYAACRAARKVYALLGKADAIGWAVREGGHAHTPADFEALLDFMDRHVRGREVRRNFQRELYPNLGDLLR